MSYFLFFLIAYWYRPLPHLHAPLCSLVEVWLKCSHSYADIKRTLLMSAQDIKPDTSTDTSTGLTRQLHRSITPLCRSLYLGLNRSIVSIFKLPKPTTSLNGPFKVCSRVGRFREVCIYKYIYTYIYVYIYTYIYINKYICICAISCIQAIGNRLKSTLFVVDVSSCKQHRFCRQYWRVNILRRDPPQRDPVSGMRKLVATLPKQMGPCPPSEPDTGTCPRCVNAPRGGASYLGEGRLDGKDGETYVGHPNQVETGSVIIALRRVSGWVGKAGDPLLCLHKHCVSESVQY